LGIEALDEPVSGLLHLKVQIDLRQMISVRGNEAMAGHGKNGIYR
jgi:hypothetical protein